MSKVLASLAMVAGGSLVEEEEEGSQDAGADLALVPPDSQGHSSREGDWDLSLLVGGPLGGKNTFLKFRCGVLAERPDNPPAYALHMTYKTIQAETKLISALLHAHGMREVHQNIPDFNLLWTGIHPKPHLLRALTPYQRVNHFPRSYELTRKDRLYKNIEKMQHLKGLKNFDFIPQTFVMPTDFRDLCSAHYRQRGPWIVKPVASSRGRGIFIVSTPEQVPLEESLIVAKYIDNPLLIDGHKCDLRLYVVVTSYDPMLIYLYEEGLVRFATVKYDTSGKHLWNPCMHLCNYSINKYHSDYIKSDDPLAENVGHKWTLSALLRHLKSQGHDTALLMQRIEELIVKAVFSSAPPIVAACKLFVPHTHNCFELYGFDILIDSNMKPWLLEVNLSPSLGCDSPLDVRVKSAMLSDLLTLIGIPAVDPMLRRANEGGANKTTSYSQDLLKKLNNCRRVQSADTLPKSKGASGRLSSSTPSLTADESRLVRSVKAEFERRGGFVRIFPSPESWRRYSAFLDPTTGVPCTPSPLSSIPFGAVHNLNLLLQRHLFPDQSTCTPRVDRLSRYERALLRGHRAAFMLDGDKGVGLESAEDAQQVSALKEQVRQSLENGNSLNQSQSRRAFGLYLATILRRLAGPTFASCETHAELILRFLQKASYNLRTPYFVKVPSRKLAGKDRVAVIAKQLNDFIYLYNRETDLYADIAEGSNNVPMQLFQRFLAVANEPELEEVLTLQTRLYKCAHIYLGRCGPQPTADLRSIGLLRSLPEMSNASDCECVRGLKASKAATSLPKLATRRPSPNSQRPPQVKSRSLDSQTPDSEEKSKPGEAKVELPKKIITIGAIVLPKQEEEQENHQIFVMRKSISLQEGAYKKAQRMATEDDINILSSEAKEAKERLSRDRSIKIEFVRSKKQSSPRNRRSLSGDSIRDDNLVGLAPPKGRSAPFPGGHRSLPRLAGAFKTREEEEAAVRRLLQPLRRD
ncbi:tubulin polyglutamylase TTLL5-like isoform X1 [Neocloeon triangulifer]|uniref:tubulin polyglutamylase TTLL5-like isoform X1 n=1 Tax=Neocloeon triangulifer TaxID=2078957 RepID=UPI00286ED8FB|nr:tubulin polyglutamylase TTLL5-like isoform X1 [Neocloeon triangulifer]